MAKRKKRKDDPQLEHEVVLLAKQGMSQRAIARALRAGRNHVKEILSTHDELRAKGHSALPMPHKPRRRKSKLDAYRDKVIELLGEYEEITAKRVFEILSEDGFDGGHSIVQELVRELRPKPKPKISLPAPMYGPGEMAESDWSEYVIEFTRAPKQKLYCFNYVLHYSGRKCFSFHERCHIHALMDGHVHAFERFEGVAAACKYDSQKPVILRWEGGQPIFNLQYVVFCTYYQFEPRACRPYHPNDKPRSERAFWELERSFLNGRRFRDVADLHRQLVDWMDKISDQRKHRDTKRTPLERFAEEKPHLRSLPVHHYDTARVVYHVCDSEGCIRWDGNRYEVPYDHVTAILPMRITATELFVYGPDLSCIATHELRRRGAGERARLPGRRPPSTRRGADLAQLHVAYASIDPNASAFLTGMEAAQPRSCAYHARKILTLRSRFGTADLAAALSHALIYSAFDHRSVERILIARATPRRLDEYVAETTARKLQALVGESHIEPRSLHHYDSLPCWTSNQGDASWPSSNDPIQHPDDPDAKDDEIPASCDPKSKNTSNSSD